MSKSYRSMMIDRIITPIAPEDKGENKNGVGLKLSRALRELCKYWRICIRSKYVSNDIRYGTGEDVAKELTKAYSCLSVAAKRYNHNAKCKRENIRSIFYDPYTIVSMTQEADTHLELGVASIRIVADEDCFAMRLDELNKLISVCQGMMRGWLIYITTRGGKC